MMGRISYHLAIIGMTCLLALSIVGCASTEPSRFYILDTIDRVSNGESDLSIGVGPIGIPDYLDRPQIVIRASPNKLKLSDFDKWAGSLKDNITQVLSENLSILLSSNRVLTYPWQIAHPIDLQVIINILRLDGQLGGHAELKSRWMLYGKNSKKLHLVQNSTFKAPVQSNDYEAYVSALNETLADLSREIAQAIKNINF